MFNNGYELNRKTRRRFLVLGAMYGGMLSWIFDYGAVDDFPIVHQSFIITLVLLQIPVYLIFHRPRKVKRALLHTIAFSVLCSIAVVWTSIELGEAMVPLLVLHAPAKISMLIMGVFFLSLALFTSRMKFGSDWLTYENVEQTGWSLLWQLLLTGLAVAFFWLVIFLLDELLFLVNITLFQAIVDTPAGQKIITSMLAAVSLAVVKESDTLSTLLPQITKSLLVLLTFPVLVIGSVFVALFVVAPGDYGILLPSPTRTSVATVMLCLAALCYVLSSAILRPENDGQGNSPGRRYAQLLIMSLVTVVTSIAIHALWTRVSEYGWTPHRIAGVNVAAFFCLFSLLNIWSLSRGPAGNLKTISTNHVRLAVTAILVFLIWLSPTSSTYRLAALSQLWRFQDGRTQIENLDVKILSEGWGRHGRAAVEVLASMSNSEGYEQLKEKLAQASGNASDQDPSRLLLEIVSKAPTYPHNTGLSKEVIVTQSDRYVTSSLERVRDGCLIHLQSDLLSCAIIVADFRRDLPGQEVLLVGGVPAERFGLQFLLFSISDDHVWDNHQVARTYVSQISDDDSFQILQDLHEGLYEIQPDPRSVLKTDQFKIIPLP